MNRHKNEKKNEIVKRENEIVKRGKKKEKEGEKGKQEKQKGRKAFLKHAAAAEVLQGGTLTAAQAASDAKTQQEVNQLEKELMEAYEAIADEAIADAFEQGLCNITDVSRWMSKGVERTNIGVLLLAAEDADANHEAVMVLTVKGSPLWKMRAEAKKRFNVHITDKIDEIKRSGEEKHDHRS